MKHKTKLLITIILIIIFVSILVDFYLYYHFLPQKIKATLQELSALYLNRNLEIKQVSLSLRKGVILKGVTLFDKATNTPLFQTETALFHPLYLPSILKRGVVIRSLELVNPYLKIEKASSGKLVNPFKEIDTKQKLSTTNKFFIKEVNITNLTLLFQDTTLNFKKYFKNIDSSFNIHPNLTLNFHLSYLGEKEEKLYLKGIYNVYTRYLKTLVSLQKISLDDFRPYLKPSITINTAYLKEGNLKIEGQKQYQIQGTLSFENISGVYKNVLFKGALELNSTITWLRRKKAVDYLVEGEVKNLNLDNLPYLEELSSLKGYFNLNKKGINLTNLEGLLRNNPITIQAAMEDFKNPFIKITAEYRTNIKELKKLIKSIKDINLEEISKGELRLSLEAKGKILEKAFNYKLNFLLKDLELKSTLDLKIKKATGYLLPQSFTVEDIKFVYKKNSGKGEARLDNFVNPTIHLRLNSNEFNIESITHYKDKLLNIEKIVIEAPDSQIVLKGEVNPKYKKVTLEGLGYVALQSIRKIAIMFDLRNSSLLEKINPAGILNVKFIIENNTWPDDLSIKLIGEGEKIRLFKIKAENIKVELYKTKNELVVSPLLAKVYNGDVDFRIEINFLKKDTVINLLINNLDLSLLKEYPGLSMKDLKGIIWAELFLENKNLFVRKDWEGEGKVVIKEGNLWEISLLRGLGEYLFIPDFDKIRINEGYGEFIVKKENIVFDEVELNSLQMNLEGQGTISFSGELNFLLFPQFNPSLIFSSEGLKKITTKFLGKTGLAIQVRGNLKNPQYKLRPAIFSPIEEFKNILKKILN